MVALFPNEIISKSARYKLLKKRIINSLDSARNNRLQLRYDFSVTHFIILFINVCAQFAGNLDGFFNFVKIARNSNPIAQSLYVYLSNFFNFVKPPNDIVIFTAPIIALNFLLDNYPPGTHYTIFTPRTWFVIYIKISLPGVSNLKGRKTISVNTFINFIKTHLKKYVESLIAGAIPTADIHSENFIRFANKWAVIKSSDTYLVCLRRRPLYDLCPGYTIYNNCVRIFGFYTDDNPSNRLSEKTRIRIHPPTVGVRVFCFDGGGVRGTLHIFGADKGVLDISSATANGNFVGFPVATVNEEPMCRIFTNRNKIY
ncbi:hypothetical protein PpBr36_02300 [Pyricularia pennisetigena]|uniref:hypothetical protein n=1 Tax=Pyricularia pennisetigena TaxID=1578925 RepID=UPI00114F37C0|nr:hypothetical protein PpBr36_02300 [Pyricularia pennisetigena]TLS30359.1 hypothetical protein PpBr36_02300 [Pyricularia pennisetigena]